MKKLLPLSCALSLTLFCANLGLAADTGLLRAAAEGNLADAKRLVKYSVIDIDWAGGSYGMTALHYGLKNSAMPSSDGGHCAVVKYLIEQGADINLRGGFPPAFTAAELISQGYCRGKL